MTTKTKYEIAIERMCAIPGTGTLKVRHTPPLWGESYANTHQAMICQCLFGDILFEAMGRTRAEAIRRLYAKLRTRAMALLADEYDFE